MTGLTPAERDVLDFEHHFVWRFQSAREQAIADVLGLSWTRYCQTLNRLLDDPAALERHPVTVRRLRHLRDSRIIPRKAITMNRVSPVPADTSCQRCRCPLAGPDRNNPFASPDAAVVLGGSDEDGRPRALCVPCWQRYGTAGVTA